MLQGKETDRKYIGEGVHWILGWLGTRLQKGNAPITIPHSGRDYECVRKSPREILSALHTDS